MSVNELYVKDVIGSIEDKIKKQREIVLASKYKDKSAIKLLEMYEKLLLKKYRELEIMVLEELKS